MIAYHHVSKQYGALHAVDDVTLSLAPGEFFALLGPNGAGKTTMLRMTCALTRPSAGTITIAGECIDRNLIRAKRTIGVVPQYTNLEPELTAAENLDYHGRLYGMRRPDRRARLAELLAFAELEHRAGDLAKTFSGGMQRRLMIMKAVMHRPSVLLLDEPTVGLDPGARRKLWDLLRALSTAGLTVLLTTHYLEEAAALCGRIAILHRGRLCRVDTPARIVETTGQATLEDAFLFLTGGAGTDPASDRPGEHTAPSGHTAPASNAGGGV